MRLILLLAFLSLSGLAFAGEITGSTVTYRSGDEEVSGYLATPAGGGPFPAVVLIHEWWGLNDWIRANADEFARRGYAALAIDLYRGKVATSGEEAHELMRGLPEGP